MYRWFNKMSEFSCNIATREELLKRWDYLIAIHPNNNEWTRYKAMALRNYDNGSSITYLGFLDGDIICEATAYVNETSGFWEDWQNIRKMELNSERLRCSTFDRVSISFGRNLLTGLHSFLFIAFSVMPSSAARSTCRSPASTRLALRSLTFIL